MRIIRIYKETLGPELGKRFGFISTAVPATFVQVCRGRRDENNLIFGESPAADCEVFALRAAGHVDVDTQSKGLCINGLKQRLLDELLDIETKVKLSR